MFPEPSRLILETDGADWPHRSASRRVRAGGLDWHVQEMGAGPVMLLLHGTGASTHSWRDLAPIMAEHYRVVMIDLPGHGFTGMPGRGGLTLPGMAGLVGALMRTLSLKPAVIVGHSSGAAVAIEAALSGELAPQAIVSINGALRPIANSRLLSPLAGLLFLNPLMPRLFAWRAKGQDAVARVLAGTGSTLDRKGVELYQRLFRNSGHVAGALGMMANWDLEGFARRLPKLGCQLILLAARGDRAVPASDAMLIASLLPGSRVIGIDRGGHLAHEEHPQAIATLILEALDQSRAA